VEARPDSGFSLEEVIGPDGRYVLYYRWADDASDDEPAAASGDLRIQAEPRRELDADV